MKKSDGFSLIELLIVLGIIGVLSSIVTPKFRNYLARGKEVKAIATLESLRTASEFYYLEHGESFMGDDVSDDVALKHLEELKPYLSNNAKKLVDNNEVRVEIGGSKKDPDGNIDYGGKIGFTTKSPNDEEKSNGINIWFKPENENVYNMKGEKWIEL